MENESPRREVACTYEAASYVWWLLIWTPRASDSLQIGRTADSQPDQAQPGCEVDSGELETRTTSRPHASQRRSPGELARLGTSQW